MLACLLTSLPQLRSMCTFLRLNGVLLQERLLGLPFLNMLANVGGFVGPYIIGALKQSTGNFNASEWVMSGSILTAGIVVLAFPLRWSTAVRLEATAAAAAALEEPSGAAELQGSKGTALQTVLSGFGSLLLAGISSGDALSTCPEALRPQLEGPAAQEQRLRGAATFNLPRSAMSGMPPLARGVSA